MPGTQQARMPVAQWAGNRRKQAGRSSSAEPLYRRIKFLAPGCQHAESACRLVKSVLTITKCKKQLANDTKFINYYDSVTYY